MQLILNSNEILIIKFLIKKIITRNENMTKIIVIM
jgi:hypothetical protein